MLSLLAAFSILGPTPAPLLQEYAIDAGHSIVEFSIGFAFSRVKGRFTQVHGTILYDPADPANSSVTVIIEANSLDTGWPHRDEHLRTSDFFDVERFATINGGLGVRMIDSTEARGKGVREVVLIGP